MVKKSIRTLLTYIPHGDTTKILFQRMIYNTFRIPFDKDFNAIKLFPDIEGALYLDIGGNNGFAVDAILMNSKKCKIYSFEPNSLLFEKTKSYFKDNNRVEVYNFGLGNEEGEFDLFIPVYRGYVFHALASFKLENAQSFLKNNNLYFYNENNLEIRKFKCIIKKLDSFELNPFFIKLDVEGYELPVLLGGKKTIHNSKPILLIESVREGDEIMKFLADIGYKVYRYSNGQFYLDEIGDRNSFLMTDEKFRRLKKI